MTRAANLAKIVTDANLEGTVDVAGAFTSLGIDDNADANAITIDSSEQIGIGTTAPSQLLHLKSTTNAKPNLLIETENAGANGGRLDFLHKSSSPADGDLLGDITFGGYSDDGTPPSDFARYVMMKAFASDVSNNAEKGKLVFSLHDGASNENNVDVMTIDGQAVSLSSTLTVGGNTTLNGKFLIDGSNNDLMTFRTTGDTSSQVLGLQFQNNSEAVTAQIFGTGDNSSSGVFRIKGIGDVAIIGGDVGVTGAAGDLVVKSGGDVHVGTGNLVIGTSGKGIDFSADAHASAMNSELLDDFEEGVWTPVLEGASGTSGVAYSRREGGYIKIGKSVTANFHMVLSDEGTISGAGKISGLPYVGNSSPLYQVATIMSGNMSMDKDQILTGMQYAGNAFIYLMIQESDLALSQPSGNGIFKDNSEIVGSVTYFT
jgi:hypothetical protein